MPAAPNTEKSLGTQARAAKRGFKRPPQKKVSFGNQFAALFGKKARFQSRQVKTNVGQIAMPAMLIVLLVFMNTLIGFFPEQLLTVFLGDAVNGGVIPGDPNPVPIPMYAFMTSGYAPPESVNLTDTFNEAHCNGVGPIAIAGDVAVSSTGDANTAAELTALLAVAPGTNSSQLGDASGACFLPAIHEFASQEEMDAALLANFNADIDEDILLYYDTAVIFSDIDTSPNGTLAYGVSNNRTGYFEGAFSTLGGSYMPQFSWVNSAYMAAATGDDTAQFDSSVKIFPSEDVELEFDFVALAEVKYYQLILHWPMPVLVGLVMYDKDKGLLTMMEMFGLRPSVYYAVTWFFGMFFATSAFVLAGVLAVVLDIQFWIKNSAVGLLIFGLAWNQSLIGMSFLISALFKSSRSAVIWTYGIVILLIGVGSLYEFATSQGAAGFGSIFEAEVNPVLDDLLLWIPTFNAGRAINIWSQAATATNDGIALSEMGDAGLWDLTIRQLIAGVLMEVIAVAYAIGAFEPSASRSDQVAGKSATEEQAALVNNYEVGSAAKRVGAVAGEDVLFEEKTTLGGDEADPALVRSIGMGRVFDGEGGAVTAVDSMTFHIRPLECFGLLGPNGAGKSTMMRLLSGEHEATSGGGFMAGYSVRSEMRAIRQFIGYCPQDNVLWGDLTAYEHLNFYARLRGMNGAERKAAVKAGLESVDLFEDRSKLVKNFSGGMKRRLSVAIAFIGDPLVVFLDEPTTGLDPKMRGRVWEIIHGAKSDRAVILTTHSMEEAEALCDRICIMANGRMFTIGSSQQLKTRWGSGYSVNVSAAPDRVEDAKAHVLTLLPDAQVESSFAGLLKFSVTPKPGEEIDLSSIFLGLEDGKEKSGIRDWGISQTTLDNVFLRVSAQAAANK